MNISEFRPALVKTDIDVPEKKLAQATIAEICGVRSRICITETYRYGKSRRDWVGAAGDTDEAERIRSFLGVHRYIPGRRACSGGGVSEL